MHNVNWGIIGCGDVTEIKSGPAFNKINNSTLTAVMRRNSKKAEDYAKRHKVPKWYDDADLLINDPDVNTLYIATPPSSHAYYTIKAAEIGKPVYVEKPMASSYNECLNMIDACTTNNVPLFVAYYRRKLPTFEMVKEMIRSNKAGRISQVRIELSIPPSKSDNKKMNLPWRVLPEIAGAGYFYDLASHQLDILDYLIGSISSASGSAANQLNLYPAEDNVTASFKFENNILGYGSWNFSLDENHKKDSIEIIGTKGIIRFAAFNNEPVRLIRNNETIEYPAVWPVNVQLPLIETIVDELTGKGKCPSTGISAARTNWVMDKILGNI